jgi:hypothetical protein
MIIHLHNYRFTPTIVAGKYYCFSSLIAGYADGASQAHVNKTELRII